MSFFDPMVLALSVDFKTRKPFFCRYLLLSRRFIKQYGDSRRMFLPPRHFIRKDSRKPGVSGLVRVTSLQQLVHPGTAFHYIPARFGGVFPQTPHNPKWFRPPGHIGLQLAPSLLHYRSMATTYPAQRLPPSAHGDRSFVPVLLCLAGTTNTSGKGNSGSAPVLLLHHRCLQSPAKRCCKHRLMCGSLLPLGGSVFSAPMPTAIHLSSVRH